MPQYTVTYEPHALLVGGPRERTMTVEATDHAEAQAKVEAQLVDVSAQLPIPDGLGGGAIGLALRVTHVDGEQPPIDVLPVSEDGPEPAEHRDEHHRPLTPSQPST